MKILVTGASGKLGQRLVRHFEGSATLRALSHSDLDIGDQQAVLAAAESFGPDAILNAAAYTAVDRSETEPEAARRGNVEGPRNLAEAARESGARLVHFSTDFVFDGSRKGPPYCEEDAPNPLSVYGRTKWEGESAVLEAYSAALVLRLSWVYGAGGWNFVDWVREEAEDGRTVRIVTDQVGTPTWVGDVARQVEKLLPTEARGIYHCAGIGVCSRFEWARETLRQAGLRGEDWVLPITSAEWPQKAPRPLYSPLENGRLAREGLLVMRPWQEALSDHLAESQR